MGSTSSKADPPDSLPKVLRALHSISPARGIPRPLTSLVGRVDEITRIVEMLQAGNIRLLTLTGTGGVGKTRVATAVANEMETAFAEGAVFVPLAPLQDSSLVAAAIANRLDLPESPTISLPETLTGYLRRRNLLLVLDNFEHVKGASGLLWTLLANCHALSILVTSRTTLNISGETNFRLSPLPVPGLTSPQLATGLSENPAVRLFVERAQAAAFDFHLTQENVKDIVEICRQLDGLPLAIELAAARTKFLALPTLLERLSNRLSELGRGPIDAPERLQTMRGAIDWSYNLLAPAEQHLFRRLAVFAGGFSLEAAEHVARDIAATVAEKQHHPAPGPSASGQKQRVTSAPVVDVIASLVDQSLLHPEHQSSETRFGMLETLKEYALEKLAASGEADETHRRHAGYYLGLGEDLASLLAGKQVAIGLNRLEIELANIRVALGWALGNGEPETALRLAGALHSFWYYHGYLSEGRRWLRAALAPPGGSATARLDGLFAAASLAMEQADHDDVAVLFGQMMDLSQSGGHPLAAAKAYLVFGASRELQGFPIESARLFEEGLSIARDLEDPQWTATFLMLLADVTSQYGDLPRAATIAGEARAIAGSVGHTWSEARALGVLAHVARLQNELDRSIQHFRNALDLYLMLGDLQGIAGTLAGIAGVVAAQGDLRRAARLLGAARQLAEAIGVGYFAHHVYAERIGEHVRSTLGEAAFAEQFAAGRLLSYEAALAETSAIIAGKPRLDQDAAAHLGKEHHLTAREIEVLRLLASRATDREIAERLFISPRTAMNHVSSVLQKLNISSRREAGEILLDRSRAGS